MREKIWGWSNMLRMADKKSIMSSWYRKVVVPTLVCPPPNTILGGGQTWNKYLFKLLLGFLLLTAEHILNQSLQFFTFLIHTFFCGKCSLLRLVPLLNTNWLSEVSEASCFCTHIFKWEWPLSQNSLVLVLEILLACAEDYGQRTHDELLWSGYCLMALPWS